MKPKIIYGREEELGMSKGMYISEENTIYLHPELKNYPKTHDVILRHEMEHFCNRQRKFGLFWDFIAEIKMIRHNYNLFNSLKITHKNATKKKIIADFLHQLTGIYYNKRIEKWEFNPYHLIILIPAGILGIVIGWVISWITKWVF